MPSKYFVVYTGWMGNGPEAVLTYTDSEEEARQQAFEKLMEELGSEPDASSHWNKHWNVQRKSYEDSYQDFEVEEITLPFLGEIG